MRRWLRTSQGTISRASLSKPIRRTTRSAVCSPISEWSPAIPLAMSCSERAEQQELRTAARARDDGLDVDLAARLEPHVARVEQARRLGDGLEQMAIDRVAVIRVALRERADVLPLRQEPRQHPLVVERLEHRDRSAPERSSRTNAARCHTSQVGAVVACRRVSDVRSNRASCSADAHAASSVRKGGIDPSASVSMCTRPSRSQTPSATGCVSICGFASVEHVAHARPHVARDPCDLARRARQIVHERVGVGETEPRRDPVLLLQCEPVGARVGDPLERDPDVEQELAPGLDAGQVGGGEVVERDERGLAAGLAERPPAPSE